MHASTRFTLAAALALAIMPHVASAQTESVTTGNTGKVVENGGPSAPKPDPQPYTLNLSVKESSGGKLVLEKNYTLTVIADDRLYSRENLRDGERIPYQTNKDQNYQSVGTNVDASGASRRGDVLLVNLDLNSNAIVATPNFTPGNLPELSEWTLRLTAVIPPGKPTLIYSAADGLSNHKVEIQATATPLNAK